jgi:epoxyqueuosine reductase
MSQVEFSAAFRGSPLKRAKLRGLKRNAAVVLGNVGTTDDVEAPTPRAPARAARRPPVRA